MSFLDIGTLALTRKAEMEARINTVKLYCHSAMENITKLEEQAKHFTRKLNCDPSELRTQFLSGMNELDEYIYVLTEFNLILKNFIGPAVPDDRDSETPPVLDRNRMQSPLQPTPSSFFDVLSEPGTSNTMAPIIPLRPPKETQKKNKLPRIPSETQLIEFSSSSVSSNSISNNENYTVEQKYTNEESDVPVASVKNLNISGKEIDKPSEYKLPPQEILEVDTVHDALIMNVDCVSLWISTVNPSTMMDLITAMTMYYTNKSNYLTLDALHNTTYCAYFDTDTSAWYRCLLLDSEQSEGMAQVYAVDLGDIQTTPNNRLQALLPEFCLQAPCVRNCHLAGIDIEDQSPEFLDKVRNYLMNFRGQMCKMVIEDNTSESLECYVILNDNQVLNHMLVTKGLAVHTNGKCYCNTLPGNGLATSTNNFQDVRDEIDTNDYPQHDDALVAVTGYHNRDEAEICKLYKGPPNKTCFKGERCKKRHIPMHPDGWTLDRVEVLCKTPPLLLPAPGTKRTVLVTCVANYNKVYVQFVNPRPPLYVQRPFGAPPQSLEDLVRVMNSLAVVPNYKQLELEPAPGELVAAIYPPDKKWYRARVLSVNRPDQNVEVQFIDYGTECWVKESWICKLEPMYCSLPSQSVACHIVEVTLRVFNPEKVAKARDLLLKVAQDKSYEALILSQGMDDLDVSLFDSDGVNLAERLAATGLVDYKVRKPTIVDDKRINKIVGPLK